MSSRRERAHVPAHLSPEVASLLSSAPAWSPRRHPNVSELADAIAGQMGGIAGDTAEQAAGRRARELRSMVPEERRDLAAVLPRDLRAMCLGARVPNVPLLRAAGVPLG